MKLVVTHRGKAYDLQLEPTSTLAELQSCIEDMMQVPVAYQKLLYGKGKKAGSQDADVTTLADAGLVDGTKIMVLGSSANEMDGLKAVESEKQRREAILAQRASRGPTKVWSRAPSSITKSDRFKFHRIQPLAHLPDPDAAEALLRRLANDPAIQHVMQQHEFSVGLLTELAPHEHPNLLGLNVNAGEAIKLRLRTNRYDGMRLYADVRRVLCHELTHNVWGDHDNNFKKLNSQLNKEVVEFDRASAAGAHRLGEGTFYEPDVEADARAALTSGAYVLGGASTADTSGDTPEGRRQRALDAAMRRMREKDEEIEQMCGSDSVAQPGPTS